MTVLCLIKQELDQAGRDILAAIEQEHEVKRIDLTQEQDYEAIIGQIESCDRVICW